METNKIKKLLFADLDGTLIDTISGDTFPKGIWDMQFKWNVLDAIKRSGVEALAIVSNQGGIEKGLVDERQFNSKMNYIKDALTDYLGIPVVYSYCPHNDKHCPARKPNTYMLRYSEALLLDGFKLSFPNEAKLMIGDASGKPGQFSDSDRKTAENFGIDYIDVDDFIQLNKRQ